MMLKHEIPKGGGTCFVCKKKCEILHYFHEECKQRWMEEGMWKPSDGKK